MIDWNVVVSVRTAGYPLARRYLKTLGRVERTDYYNVLVAAVEDVPLFLEALRRDTELQPELRAALARVLPVARVFRFQSVEEFTAAARAAVDAFVPQLAGGAFYVRIHRRGFRGRIVSPTIERQLDQWLLERLAATGATGQVRFTDPDAVVVIETLGQQAGCALVTRAARERYPFLRPE
jgi:tRNA(Ser,Leu) C12 N-acetylase TAN1